MQVIHFLGSMEVWKRLALIVLGASLFLYWRNSADWADDRHLSHLPMYQEVSEDERVPSASAPGVELHVRRWPVEDARYADAPLWGCVS